MAGEIEQVFIELVVNDDQLVSSAEKLAEMGVVDKKLAQSFKETNAALAGRSKVLQDVGTGMTVVTNEGKKVKSSFDDVNKSVDNLTKTFIQGFEEGVIAELKKAGVSTKEFNDALKKVGSEGVKGTDSLRTKMRELTQQMAALKLKGEENTEQYKKLTKEAGHLRDAINDEIKTAGSDTRVFDGLISAATGVAGAFSIAQGAAALFGEEDKELQQTLIKVQATLSILNGLQAIQNVLQKESAAAILANTIATKAQAAVQTVLTFVIGGTTGALKAFRIALAATGVGLLVIGLYELITALDFTDESLEEVNAEIQKNKDLLEADIKAVQDRTEVELSRLRSLGAAESELIKEKGRSLQMEYALIEAGNQRLQSELRTIDRTTDAWFAKNKALEESFDRQQKLGKTIQQLSYDLTKTVKDEEKKRVDDAKSAAKEREALEKERIAKLKEQRLSEFNDYQAQLDLQLLKVEKGSEEELALIKRKATNALQIELENDKLTLNQKKYLIQKHLQDQADLEKQYRSKRTIETYQDNLAEINAELQQLNITNDEKLALTIEAIEATAVLEREAAEGNASKIKEIEAKKNKDIRDARIQSIQEALDYEQQLYELNNAAIVRGLQRAVSDQNSTVDQRISAIKRLQDIQLGAINKELDALNKQRSQKLISDEQYFLKYGQLLDKKKQVTEDAEQKITDTVKQENEKRKADDQARLDFVLQTASQILSVVQSFAQNNAERENQAIQTQKQQLQDLRDNGAITEKQYLARLKKVEAEEKKIRRQQAEREKAIAIFQIAVNTAQAVIKAFATTGPIAGAVLAAVVAGIGAAQIAAVASRPLPKFARGTKYAPEGDAIVAEDRPEIIERRGRRTLVKEKAVVRLEQGDIVYNAFETQRLLQHDVVPHVSNEIMKTTTINDQVIDYNKMAAALKKVIPEHSETNFIWDEHGVNKWVQKGLNTTYYNKNRYGKK
jgi:hypothetical protein